MGFDQTHGHSMLVPTSNGITQKSSSDIFSPMHMIDTEKTNFAFPALIIKSDHSHDPILALVHNDITIGTRRQGIV